MYVIEGSREKPGGEEGKKIYGRMINNLCLDYIYVLYNITNLL